MKKIIIGVLIIVIFLCGIYTFMRLYRFRVSKEAIQLYNITITSKSTSFEVVQMDSGYHIKDYKYKINNNVMYVEFYGTMFNKFGLEDMNIVIPEGNVKEVVVADRSK